MWKKGGMCACVMWKFVRHLLCGLFDFTLLGIVWQVIVISSKAMLRPLSYGCCWWLICVIFCGFLEVGSPLFDCLDAFMAFVRSDVVLTCSCQTIQIFLLICIEWNMSSNLFCWKHFRKNFCCQNWNVNYIYYTCRY